MKESYHPFEMDYVLDEETGVGGEITLDLGDVSLTPDSSK